MTPDQDASRYTRQGATFISRFYQSSDGLKLHYRDYPGPSDARLTVLCLPGLTRNARDFANLRVNVEDWEV